MGKILCRGHEGGEISFTKYDLGRCGRMPSKGGYGKFEVLFSREMGESS